MTLISIRTAIETILSSVSSLDSQNVPLKDSLGLVLSEPVIAKDNVPFLDNSAMDGFAVRSYDLKSASILNPIKLKINSRMILAGDGSQRILNSGEAIRIMTGAIVPEECDAIVPVEDVSIEENFAIFCDCIEAEKNIRKSGEDMKAGSVVLERETIMTPAAFGTASAAGADHVTVIRRPSVAVLTCGDELISFDKEISPGKVRNSNGIVLYGLLKELGCLSIDLGTARDEKLDLSEKLDSARNADVILISGGVSMGERDLIREVLDELGFKMKFWKVQVKPGKPLLFGILNGKPVFGLPGNPVSTQVSFEIFVRPALLTIMGRLNIFRRTERVLLEKELKRAPGRPEFLRVKLTSSDSGKYHVSPTKKEQGSGITTSMLHANGLLFVESETIYIPKGESAPCLILDDWLSSEFGIKNSN